MNSTARTRIRLLDTFGLTVGAREVDIPGSSQQVVALLASRDRPMHRSVVAGTLWPGRSESRALACLRSALHRLNARAPIVRVAGNVLGLTAGVEVDFLEAQAVARDVVRDPVDADEAEPLVDLLGRELLPDWDAIWLEPTRQRHRVMRVRALEALSRALSTAGRHADAVDAARAAVAAEPDSETAEGALIAALVAEGNSALAIREFNHFRKRMWREFHVRPSLEVGDDMPRLGHARRSEVDATPSR
jgi:DNA-binding SARP family transcriptional activator